MPVATETLPMDAQPGPPARVIARQATGGLLILPATLLVLVMMVAPLVLLGRDSLNHFDPSLMMVAAFTPENYVRFFADPYYLRVMRTTLIVAMSATLLCVLFGVPIAYRLARSRSRWKSAMIILLVLPLFLSGTVRTLGWMILFTKGGMLDILVHMMRPSVSPDLMYSPFAVMMGLLSFILPYIVLILQASFEKINPALDEAAQGLGATPARAFWRIIMPLLLPGLINAAIICLILNMNAFATPLLLGGPRFAMMAPQIYTEFATNNNWPLAAALSFILMAATLVLTILANCLVPRRYRF
jgi:putative spermidine/putrescine transport system permease protein